MSETAITMRLEDWAQVLAQFKNAVSLEKADRLLRELEFVLIPRKNPHSIAFRADFDMEIPNDEIEEEFMDIVEGFEHYLIACAEDTTGETAGYLTYEGDCGDGYIGLQSPEVVLTSKEMYMTELERALPKMMALADKLGATKQEISDILDESVNYRDNRKDLFAAYFEKAGIKEE